MPAFDEESESGDGGRGEVWGGKMPAPSSGCGAFDISGVSCFDALGMSVRGSIACTNDHGIHD